MMMYALCVPVFLRVYTLVLSSSSIVFTFEGNPPSFHILTTASLTSRMPCVFLCFFMCIRLCYLPVPLCSRLKVIHHQHPYHCFPHFTSPFPISPLPCPRMYLIAVYPLSLTPTFLLLTSPPPSTAPLLGSGTWQDEGIPPETPQ